MSHITAGAKGRRSKIPDDQRVGDALEREGMVAVGEEPGSVNAATQLQGTHVAAHVSGKVLLESPDRFVRIARAVHIVRVCEAAVG